MCKTRFDSQGMILNGFYKKTFLKKKNEDFPQAQVDGAA